MCIAALWLVKALVHGFGSFWCHGAHGESLCRNIVGYHGAFVLWVAYFFKSGAQGDSKFTAIIKCPKFCLDVEDMTCLMMDDRVSMVLLLNSLSLLFVR